MISENLACMVYVLGLATGAWVAWVLTNRYWHRRYTSLLHRPCFKFREHRGGLDEAMQTVVELLDFEALVTHLRKIWRGTAYETGEVTVKPYGDTAEERFDRRIGWDTHVVCIDGHAIGFTDGPVERRSRAGK